MKATVDVAGPLVQEKAFDSPIIVVGSRQEASAR